MIKLVDGATVAIVGGGPAGTLTAIFLLDMARKLTMKLSVVIYDAKHFEETGPKGCNMCGGVISESLVQCLAVEGIVLPNTVIIDTINAYLLHTDDDAVRIKTPSQEMRIATIFRGGGPKGAEQQHPLPWTSFDLFLLQLAIQKGVQHLPCVVTGLKWHAGLPTVQTKEWPDRCFDLLVGAVGINHHKALQMFESLDFGYVRPKSTRSYVTELYYGERDVQQRLGSAMHVFLLNIPHLKFAAIIPKGHYATVVLLGYKIDHQMVEQFFNAPAVKNCLPPGWDIPVQTCQCQPWVNIGPPQRPFGDRVVLVGDACVSRLYKDGIGSAYRMAKRCAVTALGHGVSARQFQKYYWPSCRQMAWDNRLGHCLFALDGLFRTVPLLRRGLLAVLKKGMCLEGLSCPLCAAFWNTFTGSASYVRIAKNMFHPVVLLRLLWETGWQCFRKIG